MEPFKLEIGGNYFDGCGVLFAGLSCNGMFYWDIAQNKTITLGQFEEEPIWRKRMSHIAVKEENILFFIPYMMHRIPYYDMGTKEIKYCGIPDYLENTFLRYYDYLKKNDYLYIFPVCPLDDILVLSIKQKKVTGIISDWNKKLVNNYKIKKEQFMNGLAYQEEKIWISYNQAFGIFELIPDSWKIQFHKWKEITHPVVLQTNDDGFWIEDQGEGSVYHLNTSGQILEQYKSKTESKQVLFSKVIRLKNGMRMILPNYSNVLLIIDKNRRMHYRMLEKNIDKMPGNYLCYYYLEFKEEVWLLPHSQNDIVILNLKDYSIKFRKLPLPDSLLQKGSFISKMQRYESNYIIEDSASNTMLNDFCDYVRVREDSIVNKKFMESYGVKLWKELNKEEMENCCV